MIKNSIRTVFLMTMVAALFMFVGSMLGGQNGLIIAFIFAMGMNFFSYWYSDKMVLKMYNAQEINRDSNRDIYEMVEELTQRADLPMPKLYVIPQQQPNAFATGRNPDNAAVAVTQGIVQALNHEELKGVIAHELAHIKNRDILTQTIVTTVVSALTMLAQFAIFLPIGGSDRDGGNPIAVLLTLILAPIAATLLQAAISRTREYEADRVGAEICGQPEQLASALNRIQQSVERMPMQVTDRAAKSTSHMFPVNPFKGAKGNFMSLFSTHPDTEERVEKLMNMSRTGSYS